MVRETMGCSFDSHEKIQSQENEQGELLAQEGLKLHQEGAKTKKCEGEQEKEEKDCGSFH